LRYLTALPVDEDGDAWLTGGGTGSRLWAHDQQYARMFELSHFYGPWIGLLLCAGLALSGFPLDYRLVGFAVLVSAFWLYPPLLRKCGLYRLLSLCSLHHLMFVILWASHGYGGLMSPFLLWLAVVPLLGFLYLPPRIGLWAGLVASLTVSMALFIAACARITPPAVPAGMLQPMALLSILGASTYVAMMSVYLGRILASRRELQQQADNHREIAANLTRVAGEACRASAERLGMIRRLARGANGPLEEMRASSAALSDDGNDGDGQELASIAEAVGCLHALVADIGRYAQVDGAAAGPNLVSTEARSLLEQAAHRLRREPSQLTDVIVDPESIEAVMIETDATLLIDAIVQIGRHLAVGGEGRTLVLHAERMLSGSADHLVVDLALDSAKELTAPTVTQFDPQALRRPSSSAHQAGRSVLGLAIADRICHRLGGSLLAAGPPADSDRYRIVVPITDAPGEVPIAASA
jgi:hypothetical protein